MHPAYAQAPGDYWIIVTLRASFKSHSIALPVGALIVAMASIQLGAATSRPNWPPPLAE